MSTRSEPRHHAIVRATHWLTALAALALLITGLEIVVSHPRFYWGENGTVLTPALFSFPIPSSRATVPTGYSYVMPDQNGWSRYLHFEAAWALVLAGVLYLSFGVLAGHFRKHLLSGAGGDDSYNPLQRITYLGVIFVLFPLIVWTGLAMSPAVTAALPLLATAFGGRQSARTLHFACTVFLVLFVLIHVVMVWRAGIRSRLTAMIVGTSASHGRTA
jgi:thiosulfate reductase cytochrome b subunit